MVSFGKGVQRQVLSSVIVALGGMVMGTILGWTSYANRMLRDNAVPFKVTTDDTLYSSMLGIGAILGSLPAGKVTANIGPRYSIWFFETFIIVGWVMLTITKAMWILIASRTMQGIGIGGFCSCISVYIGEITEKHLRGKLGALFQVLVCVGILYTYVTGSIMKYVNYNACCGIWAVLHMVGLLFSCESPYFLLSKGKDDKAKESMAKLRDGTEAEINQELSIIKNEIESKRAVQNTLGKVLADKTNRKAIFIAIGCMFFQQMSGINLLVFYMPNVFEMTRSKITPDISATIIGVVQLSVTLVTASVVDKIGRRLLLIISSILMSTCIGGLAGYFFLLNMKLDVSSFDWLPLILVALYFIGFSIGLGPVPWIIIGEIFSSEIKPYGTSLAVATNWIMVFLVIETAEHLKKNIGFDGVLLLYSLFCLMCAVFVLFVIPETKNKTLAEIQVNLSGKSTPATDV